MVYITATPDTGQQPGIASPVLASTNVIDPDVILQPQGVTSVALAESTQEHTVSSGETLFAIAQQYNTSIEKLVELNQLENPDIITVGQVLLVPFGSSLVSPNLILLSDTRFVRGPGGEFDVASFIRTLPGYLTRVLEPVTHRRADGSAEIRLMSGADIVDRVSVETSVDPRLLLSILEYRAGWLTDPDPQELQYPLISKEASASIDREGLYRQLSWAANELNRGYYGWKYGGWDAMEFSNGPRIKFDASLNPATVGLHYFLHIERNPGDWLRDISQQGWASTYYSLFDGQLGISEPIVLISPPKLLLPYALGETWFFTGGPHGGWGSGSAWAALDFAPPDERPTVTPCYTSSFAARAVANGSIVRSNDGVVKLDLDGDNNERTGWNVLYLHLDSSTTVQVGMSLAAGEVIGYPACEGGFSTATHLHIGRLFNGEWVPADCSRCAGGSANSLTLSGWVSTGLIGQEYQGSLTNGDALRIAEQSSVDPINQVKHE